MAVFRAPVAVLFLLSALACSSSGSPPQASGGAAGQGQTSGAAGAPLGGSGGAAAGQSGAGGAAGLASGGAGGAVGGGGGSSNGGSSGASSGAAGSAGSAGSGMGPEKSAGCGDPKTLANGSIDIEFGGATREYILHVPEGYDPDHPYRLVFAFAESGASAAFVVERGYFGFEPLDEEQQTVFVAPDAANGAGAWAKTDVELVDAILAELEADLCIDKTRIFATGFSFGGAMSLALACTRADVFRGVAFFSGADLTGSCTGPLTKPIAYYASQASQDSGTGTPIPSSGRIKQAQFAEVNGCMPEPAAATFPAPGQPHKCTEYEGCSAGHPTKYCVFDGPHTWDPKEPGQAMSWNTVEAWKFITQF